MAYNRMGAARLLVVVGLGAFGCTAHGSASFGASSAGDAELSAAGEVTQADEEPRAEVKRPTSDFRYVDGQLEHSGSIEFEYNRAELRGDEQSQTSANKLLSFLNENPSVKIRIEGHTDSRGTNQYNKDLSDRRVAALRDWLIARGVDESRLTSVGKGEESPKVAEPPECHNKVPADQSVCEGPWAQNRRVEFHVTEGGEQLAEKQAEEEAPPPAPEPEPEPEPEVAKEEPERRCDWVSGLNVNALGPSSLLGVSVATQPLCWLELGLWLGYDQGEVSGTSNSVSLDADYLNLNVMLRGRFWLLERHSPIADLGIGFAYYDFDGSTEDGAGASLSYSRGGTPLIASAGIGYGYRAANHFRFGVLLGVVAHPTSLDDSSVEADPAFAAADAEAILRGLDRDGDDFTDLKPYGEVFVGWLFF